MTRATTPIAAFMGELTIRIEGRPPTPNARRHWRVTALDNEVWKSIAAAAADAAIDGQYGGQWEPLERAEAEVTFVVGTRTQRDLDNLIASTKPLTDGLVAAGVIRDDSLDVLTSVRYGWRYAKGETATIYVFRSVA